MMRDGTTNNNYNKTTRTILFSVFLLCRIHFKFEFLFRRVHHPLQFTISKRHKYTLIVEYYINSSVHVVHLTCFISFLNVLLPMISRCIVHVFITSHLSTLRHHEFLWMWSRQWILFSIFNVVQFVDITQYNIHIHIHSRYLSVRQRVQMLLYISHVHFHENDEAHTHINDS